MRQLVQRLGRLNTVLIITIVSVFLSVVATYLVVAQFNQGRDLHIALPIAAAVPFVVASLTSWHLVTLLVKIDQLEIEMRELATYDSLTGLLNRRAFLHDAENFIRLAERQQIPISVIALDLDKFKQVNDTYGHAAGDDVLRDFAKNTATIMRKSDLAGRIGGEEFELLLPNTSEETAYTLTERLHQKVRASKVDTEGFSINYSISMGLVSVLPQNSDSIESLLKQADQSLYDAKDQGRDRTVIYSQ